MRGFQTHLFVPADAWGKVRVAYAFLITSGLRVVAARCGVCASRPRTYPVSSLSHTLTQYFLLPNLLYYRTYCGLSLLPELLSALSSTLFLLLSARDPYQPLHAAYVRCTRRLWESMFLACLIVAHPLECKPQPARLEPSLLAFLPLWGHVF